MYDGTLSINTLNGIVKGTEIVMTCPDCKIEMEKGPNSLIYCPKCKREFDLEDIERNFEE